jgi:hypothetical protein
VLTSLRCAGGLTVETTSWEKAEIASTWKEKLVWDKTYGGLVHSKGEDTTKR